ncbi:MAG: hypothetical protein ACWGQW_23050 [bacterium]
MDPFENLPTSEDFDQAREKLQEVIKILEREIPSKERNLQLRAAYQMEQYLFDQWSTGYASEFSMMAP